MLDYAVLKGKKQNFTKNIEIFNIKDTIEQILCIMHDKAAMKNIEIDVKYEGFISKNIRYKKEVRPDNLLVKTDKKRVQQVFLNILSNALKFTDSHGKIIILVQSLRLK